MKKPLCPKAQFHITTAAGLLGLFSFISVASAQQLGGIAGSADLTKLVSASIGAYDSGCGCNFGASIYVSSDSGATWTGTSSPTNVWVAVASSANGNDLFAVGRPGFWISYNYFLGWIYASHDSGGTWVQSSAPTNSWRALACSADGLKLVAVAATFNNIGEAFSGGIYISTNSGATWTKTGAPSNFWSSVSLSSDGVNAAAGNLFGGEGGTIHVSTNSSATWTECGAPSLGWTSVVASADGKTLAAVAAFYQGTYASTDGGLSWAPVFARTPLAPCVACSADGAKLYPGGELFASPPPPPLGIGFSGGDTIISWLVPSTGFVLQQSPDLNSTNWLNVSTPPTLNFTNLNYQVTFPRSKDPGFYRLKER